MIQHRNAEVLEARLYLRWAASTLTPTEKIAIGAIAQGEELAIAAKQLGITRGGVWMAQQSAREKMRRRLALLNITSVEQLISEGQ